MRPLFPGGDTAGPSRPLPGAPSSAPVSGQKRRRQHRRRRSARHAPGARAGSTCRTRGRAAAVPRAAARGRRVRAKPCWTRQPPPPKPFPGGSRAATGGAEARTRRGRGRAAPPLCPPGHPPPPPSPAQRGGGSATAVPVARGPRPKPGNNRRRRRAVAAMSPALAPRSPPRRNMAARPRLPPRRPGPPPPLPPARGRATAAPSRNQGRRRPAPRPQPSCESRPGWGGCPRGLTKPTRRGGWRPGRAARAPAPSAHPRRARTKFGGPAAAAHVAPPAGAQVPRGRAPSRPAACSMCACRFVLEAL